MAQADFNFIVNSTGNEAFSPSGGSDGTSIEHASLASPLVGYGLYGRQYIGTSGFPGTIVGAIDAGVDAGVWVGTPNTHAISVRATVRVATAFVKGAGVAVKSGRIDSAVFPSMPSGYLLYIGKIDVGAAQAGEDTDLTLLMVGENPANFAGHKEVTIKGGMTEDTWHRIRMDVIPVGSSQDIIKIYTSPIAIPGSETWTLEHTEVILSSDTHYTDWSDGTSNKIGYMMHGNDIGSVAMIDGFVAMREGV